MSPQLPRLTAKEIISVLEKNGFALARQVVEDPVLDLARDRAR